MYATQCVWTEPFESSKLFLHILSLCTLVSIYFTGYLYNIIVGQKGETGDPGPKGDRCPKGDPGMAKSVWLTLYG